MDIILINYFPFLKVKGYKDDSILAYQIVSNLGDKHKSRCEIIEQKLPMSDLIAILNTHDAYVGMRLHAAIFSLIAGIPALNIGYEDKTRGIFEDLEYDENHFFYNSDIETWINKLNHFIGNYRNNINSLEGKIKKVERTAQLNVLQLEID